MSKNKSKEFAVQLTWYPVAQQGVRLKPEKHPYYGDRFSQPVLLADKNNNVFKSHQYRWDYRDGLWAYADFSNLPDQDERKDIKPAFFATMSQP